VFERVERVERWSGGVVELWSGGVVEWWCGEEVREGWEVERLRWGQETLVSIAF